MSNNYQYSAEALLNSCKLSDKDLNHLKELDEARRIVKTKDINGELYLGYILNEKNILVDKVLLVEKLCDQPKYFDVLEIQLHKLAEEYVSKTRLLGSVVMKRMEIECKRYGKPEYEPATITIEEITKRYNSLLSELAKLDLMYLVISKVTTEILQSIRIT